MLAHHLLCFQSLLVSTANFVLVSGSYLPVFSNKLQTWFDTVIAMPVFHMKSTVITLKKKSFENNWQKIVRSITVDYLCNCLWASICGVQRRFTSCLCFFAFNYLPVLCAVGSYWSNSFCRLFPLTFTVFLSFPVCVCKQACPLPAFSLGKPSLYHLKVTVGSCTDENCNLQIVNNNESGQKMHAVEK